ncbi:hypothetical protein U4E84_09305 [Halorubrum sp. AD140]|uniref:hypothetical protein n=1 Tax=Halorubrum sp. AD140 TaxID=3050073 RepID=UPI002ACD0F20|nr:hypothetical protein [Halorubrum sp. AD140]MDZ5811540.1 hypothetical protein [Halorubrum sp. AD140]
MPEVQSARKNLAIHRIQSGLRDHSDRHQAAVNIANELAPFDPITDGTISFSEDEEFDPETFSFSADHLHGVRKITEVFEDEMEIDIGHGKTARAATLAGQLSSIVSIIIAGNNLVHVSKTLSNEHEEVEDIEEIQEDTYRDFFSASCIFILECFLFTTPLNYKIAWRGTRFLNNQYLYHLRGLNRSLYRITLSEIHYLIRDVVPATLRSSVDEVASYLVWAGTTTLQVLDQHGELKPANFRQHVEDVVAEFRDTAIETYEIPDSLISEIEPEVLYKEIIESVRGNVGFKLPSTDELLGELPDF